MVTAQNENSLALANLNFDFTLVKLEAPVEFMGLGTTISTKRKNDAEEGPLHRTARRLGALFKDVLPPTDELFRAYGKRASEISAMPTINPHRTSDRGGMFANHIGADTASIWAAATSGSAAISVHLLGCMLARIFTGPEAVSIWVELVQRQKARSSSRQESALYTQEHNPSVTAAQQDISRADLASWDSSARAWLQSADQAKALQHKQTMLIVNNTSVPVNKEPDTYTSVIKAWTTALLAMNNLVTGMPQRVQDGAALLAISSWHLYPDMVVYSGTCVNVNQRDPLFDHNALLTVGLQEVRDRRSDTQSVYWSLPLACLQYYGHPVQATRSIGQENSRISCQQFPYIILGCLFDGWGTYATTNEGGLHWIEKLGAILKLDDLGNHNWLHYLLEAARVLHSCKDWEKRAAYQLMNLGRRRSTFLNPPGMIPAPLFGLSDVDNLLEVLGGDEQYIQCLRQLCSHLNLSGSQFLVQTRSKSWTEYASVNPVRRPGSSNKRTSDGRAKEDGHKPSKLVRWICLTNTQLRLCISQSQNLLDASGTAQRITELEKAIELLEREERKFVEPSTIDNQASGPQKSLENKIMELRDRIVEMKEILPIGQRLRAIEEIGELCLPVAQYSKHSQQTQFRDKEIDPQVRLMFSYELDFIAASKDILQKLDEPAAVRKATIPNIFTGNPDLAAIVSISPSGVGPMPSARLGPEFVEAVFNPTYVDAAWLDRYLNRTSQALVRREIISLQTWALMADIYSQLPGATISTLVVRQSLRLAKWIPRHDVRKNESSLTLPQVFACVAMFDSGTCNLDPEELSQVFALSSGNSLYVAGSLLCDPYKKRSPADIQRVVGNIGRAGITFLICPPEVKLREADPEKWMAINHNPFDGKLEDYFQETSIHLSFTEYEIPITVEGKSRHAIDREVVLVESLLSIYDRGAWVGELDVFSALSNNIYRLECYEEHRVDSESQSTFDVISRNYPQLVAIGIENWDELIEAPKTRPIAIKAHKNWLARVAVTAICRNNGFLPIVVPEHPCWACCAKLISQHSNQSIALIC
jgi:hypothetical protein